MTFFVVKFYNTRAHGTLFLFSASSPIQMRNFKGLLFLEKMLLVQLFIESGMLTGDYYLYGVFYKIRVNPFSKKIGLQLVVQRGILI